jgi:peroxiredoxin (alkyl hydroperoxide reductase subunit C)
MDTQSIDQSKRVEIPGIGERFPAMKVSTTQGVLTLPEHFAGKWFLIFSHPGDFTPVCTTEFVSLAKHHQEFRDLGCELIGLSVDQLNSHIVWTRWIKDKLDVTITFPIIADPYGTVAKTLGAIHPAAGPGAIRESIFVDPKGHIRSLLLYPKGVGRNVDELVRMVKALKTVDEHGVVTPANWPHNEIVGADILLRPPSDEAEAEKRGGKKNCLDWWFCHESLDQKEG